jgi:hypothetical protein
MAEQAKTEQTQKPGRAHEQTSETEVKDGPISTVADEQSPAADQSNRDAEMAARMAVTPPKTRGDEKKANGEDEGEVYQQRLSRSAAASEFDDEGKPTKFVDPDDLEAEVVNESFPTTYCQNCKNHGRGEVKLDKKGFCEQCGFKLNRVSNRALEPAQK